MVQPSFSFAIFHVQNAKENKKDENLKGVILQSVLSMAKVEAKEIIIAFGDFRRVE